MADENTISLEALKEYAELLAGEARTNAEAFIATLERSNLTMAGASEVTKALGVSVSEIGNAVKDATGLLENMVAGLRSNFNLLGSMVREADENIDDLGETVGFALAPMFNLLPRATDAFSNLGKAGNISGSMITAGYSDVAPMFESLIGGITRSKTAADFLSKGFQRLAQSSDIGTNLERNLVRLAARAGDLNSLLNEQGLAYRDLKTESSSYSSLTYEVAQATGASVEEVQKYAESLSVIPGSLRRTTETVGGLRRSMSELEAVMKVATAFGMSNAESTQIMNFAYSDLGKVGTDAVSIVANIAETSQDSVLPLQMVTEYVQRTSGAFKLLGDNSQGAMNVLRTFSPILRESGLGPAGIQEIVQGMTSGIERMDIAHKAFISGATGGPGGLAGGFEMDYLIQQGNFDEVLNKTMEAMQNQFGRQPVTLEDVNKTPELAGELLKQVTFLKDVAGIAQNDQQAYRILEAMQKGAPEKLAQEIEQEAPTAVLEKSLSLGQELQERGNTWLSRIHNRITHLGELTAISNAQLARRTIGIEGVGDLSGAMRESAQNLTVSGGAIGAEKPIDFNRAVERQVNAAMEMTDSFKEVGRSILERVGFDPGVIEESLEKFNVNKPVEKGMIDEQFDTNTSSKTLQDSLNSIINGNLENQQNVIDRVLNFLNIKEQKPTSEIDFDTVGPRNIIQETFKELPGISEEERPGLLTTAINQAISERKQEQPQIIRDNNAPIDGTIDVNIKLTGIDEINAVIEKKVSMERRKATQGAFIGNEG